MDLTVWLVEEETGGNNGGRGGKKRKGGEILTYVCVGVEKGLYFSFPVTCEGGQYKIVQGLKFDQYGQVCYPLFFLSLPLLHSSQEKMDKTQQELKDEKKAIEHLLK